MGLLDMLKRKEAPKEVIEPHHNYYKNDDEGVYLRKVKVAGVTFKNDDGTSRQKILKDIKTQKPPFDKKLDIGIEEFEWEGKPAYYVTVNGVVIGTVEKSMSAFITNNKDRISGLVDFWVNQDEDEDGKKLYFARLKIQVDKKN